MSCDGNSLMSDLQNDKFERDFLEQNASDITEVDMPMEMISSNPTDCGENVITELSQCKSRSLMEAVRDHQDEKLADDITLEVITPLPADAPKSRRKRKNSTVTKITRISSSDSEFVDMPAMVGSPKIGRRRLATISKRFSCDLCNRNFPSQGSLKKHRTAHFTEKRYQCEMCGKRYLRKNDYKSHMNVHGDNPYGCPHCGKALSSKNSQQKHISTQHMLLYRNKSVSCDICGLAFEYESQLRIHKQTHCSQKSFICEVCGRTFKFKGNLQAHSFIHLEEKPFKCDFCNKGFAWKNSFLIHRRGHTGEKPYLCSICGKTFISAKNLRRHTLTHGDGKPYKCKECEKAFRSRSALDAHRFIHKGYSPYHCKFCGKSFNSQPNYRKHTKRHTGERPHVCGCGKAFVSKQELTNHMKVHANIKETPLVDDRPHILPLSMIMDPVPLYMKSEKI